MLCILLIDATLPLAFKSPPFAFFGKPSSQGHRAVVKDLIEFELQCRHKTVTFFTAVYAPREFCNGQLTLSVHTPTLLYEQESDIGKQ